MKKKIIIPLSVLIAILIVVSLYYIHERKYALGTGVLSEANKDIGFGYLEVSRSQKNPPGHWEGIGHFTFFYYKDKALSQTDTYSISPSGEYALFQDGPSGKGA